MTCPNCGSSRVSFELRAAGTDSKTKYYRTGVKSSWVLPSGKRSYNSQRRYKSMGICHNCGYYWESEKQSKTGGFLGRCVIVLVYLGAWLGLLESYGTTDNTGKAIIALILAALTVIPLIKPAKKLIKWIQKRRRIKPRTIVEPLPESRVQSVYTRYADRRIVDTRELAIESGKIAQELGGLSIPTLQRCLQIGSIRASKLLEYLENQGVTGLSGTAKDRPYYAFRMTDTQFQQWIEAVKRSAPPEL